MSNPGHVLRRLIGKCAELARENVPLDPALRSAIESALAHLMSALATLQAAAFSKRAASAPGYVDCEPTLVPFYLLEDIPNLTVLAELAALGYELQLTNEGTICLSGSAVLLGSLEFIGDLDFCEYAPHDRAGGASRVVSAIDVHVCRSCAPLCERVKVFEPSFSAMCPDGWHAEAQARLAALVASGAYHLKLDFIAHTAAVGVVEATNVVLLLDGRNDGDAIAKSFAAQEVPIGSGSIVLPRQLNDPLQLGHYINFLYRQTEHYATRSPVKALKRALSLARMLLLDEHDGALVTLLQDDQGSLQAAIQARQELAERLATVRCMDTARAASLTQLQADLASSLTQLRGRRSSAGRDTWYEDVADRLRRLLSDVKPLIAAG